MKTKLMIAMSLILAGSIASAAQVKVACTVAKEGSTPGYYNEHLAMTSGDLSLNSPLKLHDFGVESAYAAITEDGNLSLFVGSPLVYSTGKANKSSWLAMAVGGTDIVVLGLSKYNVMISCGKFKAN